MPEKIDKIRLFLTSPDHLAEERGIVREVVAKLNRDPFLRHPKTAIEIISWDDPLAKVGMEVNRVPQRMIDQGIPKPSECDITVTILWWRIGTLLHGEEYFRQGRRLTGTEWEFYDGFDGAGRNGHPRCLVYWRKEPCPVLFDDPAYEAAMDQSNGVRVFLKQFRNEDGSFKGGVNPYSDLEDFKSQLDHHLRERLSQLAQSPIKARSGGDPKEHKDAVIWQGRSPYPGLTAFNEELASVFFGREAENDLLISRFDRADQRFVAVVGASGSGKSSLVWAGVIPALKQRGWVCLRMVPAESDDPFQSLAVEVPEAARLPDRRARDLASALRADPLRLDQVAEQLLADAPANAEWLLFIDQFEELFTRTNAEDAGAFVQLIDHAASHPRIRLVVTLRADFAHHATDWPALTARMSGAGASLWLGHPAPTQLAAAIRRPALAAGLVFDPLELPDLILAELKQEPGALALLAFTLQRLYAEREGLRLTEKAYREFGGVQGALGDHAEKVYGQLPQEDREAIFFRLFRALVDVDSESESATRKRARLEEFAGDHQVLALIEAMSSEDARLLVGSHDSDQKPVIEVAHEALFRHWDRLREWIKSNAEDLHLLRRMELNAREWARDGARLEDLWRPERMEPIHAMLIRLGKDRRELPEPQRSFCQTELDRWLQELDSMETDHKRRMWIGDHLAQLGDPRPGIGLREDGLPDIRWCQIPAGKATLEQGQSNFEFDAFYLACYPITFLQYQVFTEAADGYANGDWWVGLERQDSPGRQKHPVLNCPADNVSWYDAVAFCRWLSDRLGYEVRLPTEWEWQWVAQGGDKAWQYPWGDKWCGWLANAGDSGLGRTTAVGLYPCGRSDFGPEDMAGNVWEWCLTMYDKSRRCEPGGDAARVLRGCSWFDLPGFARASIRYWYNPGYRDHYVGFRVLCSAPIR